VAGLFFCEGDRVDSIWWKIAAAALLATMLVYLYPAAKHWSKHGPKAGAGDWNSAILALLGVAGFVALLILMVR
jgi:uncharacterized membrane protein YphA (DoxX/SURF4 family)